MNYDKIWDIASEIEKVALNLKDLSALKDGETFEIVTPGASYTTSNKREVSLVRYILKELKVSEKLELISLVNELSNLVLELEKKKPENVEITYDDVKRYKILTSKNWDILLDPASYNSNFHRVVLVPHDANTIGADFNSVQELIEWLKIKLFSPDSDDIRSFEKIVVYEKASEVDANHLKYLIINR